MVRRSLVVGLVAASLVPVLLSSDLPRADALPTILASASFEADAVGATARPNGPPTVAEDVWDAGTYSGGVSGVVAYGSTKRYRLSDVGSTGEVKGIRLPLSSDVSTGTLMLECVATAEQADVDGGFLCAERPEKDEWICGIGFGADGKFRVHGSGTTVGYSADAAYRFRVILHFGASPTADYRILEIATGDTVLSSDGHSLPSSMTAGHMVFRTDASDAGAFTVDALSAVR